MRALLCVVATAAALSGSARPPPRPPRGKSKGRSRAQRRGNVNVPSSVPEDESIDAREARLAELTKDYPAEFDKAIKFFLERFKPEDDAEAAEAAAWRSWLENPQHVAWVAQKATGKDADK